MSYNATTNRLNAYKQTRVKTASQSQMIIMLYDEAIKQIDLAASCLETQTKELDKVHNAIVTAQSCITELTVGLDMENGGDLADRLYGLYRYFNRQLMEANIKKSSGPLRAVRKMLHELRQSWQQVAQTQSGSPSGESDRSYEQRHDGNINFAG